MFDDLFEHLIDGAYYFIRWFLFFFLIVFGGIAALLIFSAVLKTIFY